LTKPNTVRTLNSRPTFYTIILWETPIS